MIIIEMVGYLGNQMFHYALYLKLKSMGKEVCFDLSWYEKRKCQEMRIDRFFDVELPSATEKDIARLADNKMDVFSRVRRKLIGRKGHVYTDIIECAQPQIFEMDDVYLRGYWQSEKYFTGIEEEVRKTFRIKENLTSYQKGILTRIQETESVSVHVRRVDYLDPKGKYAGICTEEYYEKAMKQFAENEKIHFFVFSDDYEYVKRRYQGDNVTVVKPEKEQPYCNMDMHLMSQCKHNIIANSSFSWWGTWLNENKRKIVVAPPRWQNERNMKDIYCENWKVV